MPSPTHQYTIAHTRGLSRVSVTNHAIERYQQRVEPCSDEDAAERLQHAVSIAKPASPAMVYAFRGRDVGHASDVYLYCDVERLFLVCRPDLDGYYVVLTVWRAVKRAR